MVLVIDNFRGIIWVNNNMRTLEDDLIKQHNLFSDLNYRRDCNAEQNITIVSISARINQFIINWLESMEGINKLSWQYLSLLLPICYLLWFAKKTGTYLDTQEQILMNYKSRNFLSVRGSGLSVKMSTGKRHICLLKILSFQQTGLPFQFLLQPESSKKSGGNSENIKETF